jgi:hypothetical protein
MCIAWRWKRVTIGLMRNQTIATHWMRQKPCEFSCLCSSSKGIKVQFSRFLNSLLKFHEG